MRKAVRKLFWVPVLLESGPWPPFPSHCLGDLPMPFPLCPQFQDEMGLSNVEDDGPEEEERVAEPRPSFNTPQALR